MMQALVKVPLRRIRVADSIKKARDDRQGFVDLAAFLDWLWRLTVLSERYCRDMCMWLMDKLATLQMEDAMLSGGHCVPLYGACLVPFLALLPWQAVPQLLYLQATQNFPTAGDHFGLSSLSVRKACRPKDASHSSYHVRLHACLHPWIRLRKTAVATWSL